MINLTKAYQEKDSAFECGFHSFLGQNRTQFSVSFFIFGLLFLLFDLEILLVYPYSVSSYTNDIYGLVVMMVFFVLLTLGFIFELGKNALTIDSRQTSSYSNNDTTTPVVFISKDSFLKSSTIGSAIELSQVLKINYDINSVLLDMLAIKADLCPVLERMAFHANPDIVAKYAQFAVAFQQFNPTTEYTDPAYHTCLRQVLLHGWTVEYLMEHFDSALTSQDKGMLEVHKDTIANSKQDLQSFFADKRSLLDNMEETKKSDLMREIKALIDKDPFKRIL